jgi:hypothetical protein
VEQVVVVVVTVLGVEVVMEVLGVEEEVVVLV